MLHLKRSINAGICIAGELTITVRSVRHQENTEQGRAFFIARAHGATAGTIWMLAQGQTRTIETRAGMVRMKLEDVYRGEAVLSFDAPRSIEIQRLERQVPV
jgi:sRNA-binding carbon storage regulator CsrA